MLTCLCDALYGDVGAATVKALEHAGCEVVFPEDQTCCGQPPFNAGDWDSARPIAERTIKLFGMDSAEQVPIVTPSASCAAMLRHGYKELIPGFDATHTYELCEFIVNVLGKASWGGEVGPTKVALHSSCHGRMLGLQDEQMRLLHSIRGVHVVDFASPEQCCGFGGGQQDRLKIRLAGHVLVASKTQDAHRKMHPCVRATDLRRLFRRLSAE